MNNSRRFEYRRTPEERDAETKRREAVARVKQVQEIFYDLERRTPSGMKKPGICSKPDYDIVHYGVEGDYLLAKVVWKGRNTPEWAKTTHSSIAPVTFLAYPLKKEAAEQLAKEEPTNPLRAFFPGAVHVLHTNLVPKSASLPMKLIIRFHDPDCHDGPGASARSVLLNKLLRRVADGNLQLHAEPTEAKEGGFGLSSEYVGVIEKLMGPGFNVSRDGNKRVFEYEEPRTSAAELVEQKRKLEEQIAADRARMELFLEGRFKEAEKAEEEEAGVPLFRGPRNDFQAVASTDGEGKKVWTLERYTGKRLKAEPLSNLFPQAKKAGIEVVGMCKAAPGEIHGDDLEAFVEHAEKHGAELGKRTFDLAVVAHVPSKGSSGQSDRNWNIR